MNKKILSVIFCAALTISGCGTAVQAPSLTTPQQNNAPSTKYIQQQKKLK
jgi:peptidoglycan hydrolase CwlO-like protein